MEFPPVVSRYIKALVGVLAVATLPVVPPLLKEELDITRKEVYELVKAIENKKEPAVKYYV